VSERKELRLWQWQVGGRQLAETQTLHSGNNIIEGLKFKLLSAKTLQLN